MLSFALQIAAAFVTRWHDPPILLLLFCFNLCVNTFDASDNGIHFLAPSVARNSLICVFFLF